jgi:hypothetical protein
MKQIVRRECGDVEDRKRGKPVPESVSQGPAVQLGHDHIGDDEMQVRMGEYRHPQSFFAVPRLERPIPGVSQHPGKDSAHEIFVLGDQDDAGIGVYQLGVSQKHTQGGGGKFRPQASCRVKGAQRLEPATSSFAPMPHPVARARRAPATEDPDWRQMLVLVPAPS